MSCVIAATGFGREDEDNFEVKSDLTIIFHVPRPCVLRVANV